MMKLEQIAKDAQITGVVPGTVVRVVSVDHIGEDAVAVVYRTPGGHLGEQTLFRGDESRLGLATAGRAWAFDAPPADFKLGLEAFRIHLAHLFDPMMAVHTSDVDPLPHQITAVYEAMLPRQPLRFLLADDPGAGKTIMAGLLVRELLLRADAARILIVAPGSLVGQWQDELYEKFGLDFVPFTRELDEVSRTGNAFEENRQLIARLDQLARNDDLREKLAATEWDLIIVDEAHKMAAHYFGNDLKKSKRYELGELLGSITRHFLLMTATPHSGKEADFQLFLALLDGDRFYGKARQGSRAIDPHDLMRRMVKEDLVKFDGTPLFPERRAYTLNYRLSDLEADLYNKVTDYVTHQMDAADRLDGKRKGTVGFALTQLQRRLASSPESIYQSLKRRHKKLQRRLEEEKLAQRGHHIAETLGRYDVRDVPDDIDEADEEMTGGEYETWAEEIVDTATASATIEELAAEIEILKGLEQDALDVVHSRQDRKWEELSRLLQDEQLVRGENGRLRKLIIFSEYRDTLNYLVERIGGLLGDPEAVVTIHGSVNRDDRRKAQERFRFDPGVLVLVATDAAGEGVNLQNAHLMVNYDLPWNPNRLEQRFGRIHRIGQTEVCHLWNLVAHETREGADFQRLFEKIETERAALGGRVFDVLGEAFENRSLKDMLIEAIRYGDRPDVRDRLNQAIDGALDPEQVKELLRRHALAADHMSIEDLYAVKEEMERAEARRLQPYFVRSFFAEAFQRQGGEMRPRETGRYEIRHVPHTIRERDRVIGETRTPVLKRYDRICFEKSRVRHGTKPMAALVHPGHPLMRAVTDLTLEAHRNRLKQGAVLLDPADPGTEPRVLLMLDHSVRLATGNAEGQPGRTLSRRLQFVALDREGQACFAGWAPHLDLDPLPEADHKLVADVTGGDWLSDALETQALRYATAQLVPEHYDEVRTRQERQIDKIRQAVHARLYHEIGYWTDRYHKLKDEVAAGKQPRMQPENARRRAEELTARLEQRQRELDAQRHVVSSTPVVIGGALVIPQGLLDQRRGVPLFSPDAQARARIERIAMEAVTAVEEGFGHQVFDVSAHKCGWDLTARPPVRENGALPSDRHIEVKGRAKGAPTVTLTRNEIAQGLNQGDKFILAIVLVDGDTADGPYYLRNPFQQEPEFGVSSVNYDLADLLSRAMAPMATLDSSTC
jgi:superfamily II DNA or RNA helicase